MGHFAKVVNGVVVNVIRAESEFFDAFVDTTPGDWIQTSINTRRGVHFDYETGEPDGGIPLRKNYANVGYTYDKQRDAFIPPKPADYFVFNEEACDWDLPKPLPSDADGKNYQWDAELQNWVDKQ